MVSSPSACADDNTLSEFVAGALSATEAEQIEHHLDQCAMCRRTVSALGWQGQAEAPAGDLLRGAVVGRYVILDKLGEDAMAVVYTAHDPELHRKIAIKLVHSSSTIGSSEAHVRQLREAQAMAGLVHPNVVAVFDVATVAGEVFIAMERVEGTTAAAWLAAAPRTWSEVRRVMVQAGEGLAAAHDAGLVHRDFNPGTVLVGNDGRVRVGDFGRLLGTPAYMAPEQYRGDDADARTDQFSYCVAFYEALHGERPFAGDTIAELAIEVASGNLRARPRRGAVPDWLDRAILRGLERDPDQRWPSMHALLAALRRDPRAARRRATTIATTALLAIAIVAGASRLQTRTGDRGIPEWQVEARFALARALWDGGGDHARACAFASVARADYARQPAMTSKLHEVDAWLTRCSPGTGR